MGYTPGFDEPDGHEFSSGIIDEFEAELPEILDIIRRGRNSKRRSIERLEALTAKVRAAMRGEEVTP